MFKFKLLVKRFLLLSVLLAAPLLAARLAQADVPDVDDAIIIDSDPITGIGSNVPGVDVSPTHVDVTEGGVASSYAVALTARPSAPVMVTIQADEQISLSTLALTFDETNWSVQQVVIVTAVDDSVVESPLHVGVITHSVASADEDYDGLDVSDVVAVITDNDAIRIFLPLAARNLAPRYKLGDAPDACPGRLVKVRYSYLDGWNHKNDDDWYAFRAIAGVTYAIETTDLTVNTDTILMLYSKDCNTLLAKNDDLEPGDRASQIVWQATSTGVHHVLVYGFDGRVYGPSTGYTFRATVFVPEEAINRR